jgi:hypothetical protein
MGTAVVIAAATALQAVDGVALRVVVERWATASGDARQLAFEAAFAVRQIEIGLASLFSLVSGLTLVVFALALVRSTRYPTWLGGLGLVGGLGLLAASTAQATTGFSGGAMTLSMAASAVLLLWIILVAVRMWRWADRLPPVDEGSDPRDGREACAELNRRAYLESFRVLRHVLWITELSAGDRAASRWAP